MSAVEFFRARVAKDTIGGLVTAILAVDNKEDAKQFYLGYVEDLRTRGVEDTEGVARSNIGWCFGEGMSDSRRQMWIEVCNASHPAFGQVMPASPEQAFLIGAGYAALHKKEAE